MKLPGIALVDLRWLPSLQEYLASIAASYVRILLLMDAPMVEEEDDVASFNNSSIYIL
jgi:hypothetical protein